MTIKGYSSQKKEDRLSPEFATLEPVRLLQHALSVIAHQFVFVVGTDAVEANSTTSSIVATAHAAQKGDIIRFTSGTLSGQEVKVASVSANAIVPAEDLPSAPAAAVSFEILRHKYPKVDSSGVVQTSVTVTPSPILFTLDSADQEVLEDTGTPANNRPMPVKLLDELGNENTVTVGSSALPTGAATAAKQDTGNTSLSSIDGKITACNTGAVVVSSSALPTGAATSAKQDTGNTSLASIDGKVTACNTGAVVVSSSALPTGAATEAKQDTGNTSLSNIDGKLPAALTGSGNLKTAMQEAIPAGSNTIGKVDLNRLNVVDLCDTPLVTGTSINGSAGAFYEAVASLAATVKAIQALDTTGVFIGVYTGAAASEALVAVIPPGADGAILDLSIASGTRVALRALEATGPAGGSFAINFLG